MGNFNLEGFDDLIHWLSSMEIDDIAPKMLEESAPILEQNLKARAASHQKTGDMLKSIKTTKTSRLKNNDGYSITVRPTGKDKRGVRNMEKMVYMEYGTSKQSATPVLTPAIRESRESVEKKMQEVFDREVGD